MKASVEGGVITYIIIAIIAIIIILVLFQFLTPYKILNPLIKMFNSFLNLSPNTFI